MVIFLTIIHVIVCFFLVIVVLLQSGKAADLAGAFGGMGSQTAFGPRGAATVLSKATTFSAVVFMITSMTLAIYATRTQGGGSKSVLETQKSTPLGKQQKSATPNVSGQQGAQPGQTVPVPATPNQPAPAAPKQ
jgi:preprotein translocase subunit SecG